MAISTMYSLVCSKYVLVGLVIPYVRNYSTHWRVISCLCLIPHPDSWDISSQKQDQDIPIYWYILHLITYINILLLENPSSLFSISWMIFGEVGVYSLNILSLTSREEFKVDNRNK